MSTVRRQTNSYPAYEIDLDLQAIKTTVRVIQFTTYRVLAPLAGSQREIPGPVDYMIDAGSEGMIDVNEVREMNGMTFPGGAVFQSLDDRVYFSKSYFDEMNQDD